GAAGGVPCADKATPNISGVIQRNFITMAAGAAPGTFSHPIVQQTPRGRRGAGRGDTGRLEVVSKSRRQALRSCAVGLVLVSKPHARWSGKAGTPFLRPLLALSSVGRESSRGIEPRCGSRPPCVLAPHPVSPLPESRSL